ncbi:hypothetical protein [Streptomyces roseochromogenus]|uniref:hypothetical protein n=1 Tax=Streptomyces roseochromogenus TaxID=285450 RepID=UPI000AFFBB8C|nr:hypothetical protein [Streptomyces roseochromogenus]
MTQGTEPFSKNIDEFLAKIRDWYKNDHEQFKTKYEMAIQGLKPYPDGTPDDVTYPWKSGIECLCGFFRDWYSWEPHVRNGLEYIEKFSWLSYNNKAGLDFVLSGPGREMTADFTHLQGLQMDGKIEEEKNSGSTSSRRGSKNSVLSAWMSTRSRTGRPSTSSSSGRSRRTGGRSMPRTRSTSWSPRPTASST